MGKKSRRLNKKKSKASAEMPDDSALKDDADSSIASDAGLGAPSSAITDPPQCASDACSDVGRLRTTSQSLQAKLDRLTELGAANDRAGFVNEFVPLDLSREDAEGYLRDLTTAPEAEGQWRNLVAEIAAIRDGRGVERIEADQTTSAVFFFRHPLLEKCDREVAFCCRGGEWRAEG